MTPAQALLREVLRDAGALLSNDLREAIREELERANDATPTTDPSERILPITAYRAARPGYGDCGSTRRKPDAPHVRLPHHPHRTRRRR
jgi:hypothetical protein